MQSGFQICRRCQQVPRAVGGLGLQAIVASVVAARPDVASYLGEERLGRGKTQSARQIAIDAGIVDALQPALAGKHTRRRDHVAQRRLRRGYAVDEIAVPLGETARRAPSAPGRAANPTAQVGCLDTRQVIGERPVGGVEQVVPFVEHDTAGRRIARGCRVAHQQGVVGYDDGGAARPPDRSLSETLTVVAARRMNAFAAPVGKLCEPPPSGQLAEPCR